MPEKELRREWEDFRERAAELGLTAAWVLPRERVEPHYPPSAADGPPANRGAAPAALLPTYRRAVVLGSGGPLFWDRFRAAADGVPHVAEDPLDRYTVRVVEELLADVRRCDPRAVAAYPFRHPRQILPFHRLVAELPFLAASPLGISIDPRYGPWFAWRAVILGESPWPVSSGPAAPPCVSCPAPCVDVCPSGAVTRAGFRWHDCADYRLQGADCQSECRARTACPVGASWRYSPAQTAYHYGASLRMIDLYARAATENGAGPRGGAS